MAGAAEAGRRLRWLVVEQGRGVVAEEHDAGERAKELLVYGPVGLALFLRDTAPQFLRMFVARGRTEVEQRRRAVGDQIDQLRTVGENAAADGGPELLRAVANGIAAVRERAEEALTALGALTPEGDTRDRPPTTFEADERKTPPAPVATVHDFGGPDLAIADYDDLSASQVVDRLEGLARDDLEAIRAYEGSHRGRNTILAKIEQLTRPAGG